MTTQKLTSQLKIFVLLGLFFCSCGQSENEILSDKLFIVVDKSKSVVYKNSAEVSRIIRSKLLETYGTQRCAPEFFVAWIDSGYGKRNHKFSQPYPSDADAATQTGQMRIMSWENDRADWFDKEAESISERVKKTPVYAYTDIFSLLGDIEKEKNTMSPGANLNVVFFSDMIHEASEFNLSRLNSQDDLVNLGKEKCRELKDKQFLSSAKCDNITITINHPEMGGKLRGVKFFWKAFFREWGIPDDRIDFNLYQD